MSRAVRVGAWAGWPVGLVLVLAHTMGEVFPTPVFLVLDVVYVAGMLVLVRALRGGDDRVAAALVLAGVGVFALAGLTGAPTAARPGAMLLNAVVLLAVAATLLIAAVRLALRARGSAPAVLAVVALVVGSTGYLANLLARWAVVASGAAGLQVGVEDTAWIAAEYLPGLPGEPTYVVFLLVWFDLLQLAYVVTTYLGFGALAVALGRGGAVSARVARAVGTAGGGLAALTLGGAALAGAVPGVPGTVAAWTAFLLTIPFMSTLLPYVLGIGLLTSNRPGPRTPAVPAAAAEPDGAPLRAPSR